MSVVSLVKFNIYMCVKGKKKGGFILNKGCKSQQERGVILVPSSGVCAQLLNGGWRAEMAKLCHLRVFSTLEKQFQCRALFCA